MDKKVSIFRIIPYLIVLFFVTLMLFSAAVSESYLGITTMNNI